MTRLYSALAVGWTALILSAVWLCRPALSPVHVEGFSASIVALGLHLAQGTLADFYPSQPFATEYFGLTKLGAVLGVAGLAKLTGAGGDPALRLIMAAGALMMVASSAWLVRRWTGAPWMAVAAAILLAPGVAESCFFFNDNVPGTGLLLSGFVLVELARSWRATVIAGLLVGLAITVRTDLALAAPAVALILWRRFPPRAAASRTAAVAASAIAVLCACYALVGASPLDAVRVGAVAVELWSRPADLARHGLRFVLFIGAPGLLLALVGLADMAARHRWRELALASAIPLLVNLALLGKMWEVRQFLPLTPFLAIFVALGIERLHSAWRGGDRLVLLAVGGAVLVLLVAPPALTLRADGPRALMGRFRSVPAWRAWQASVRRNIDVVDAAIDSARPNETRAILTNWWNEDRYLHLRLIDRGFQAIPVPAACAATAELFVRGDRRVLHVSLQQSFVAEWAVLQPERLARRALPCLRALPSRPTLLADAALVRQVVRKGGPALPADRLLESPFAFADLSPSRLERLALIYHRQGGIASSGRFGTVDAADRALKTRTGFAR